MSSRPSPTLCVPKEGELPYGMVVLHNDGQGDEDDGEEDEESEPVAGAEASRASGKQGRDSRAAVTAAAGSRDAAAMPLKLGSRLTVLDLGRIEFLNVLFHNESHLHPVGYCAVRMLRTAASGGMDVLHRMEIAVSEDGCRPVFRWETGKQTEDRCFWRDGAWKDRQNSGETQLSVYGIETRWQPNI